MLAVVGKLYGLWNSKRNSLLNKPLKPVVFHKSDNKESTNA